MKQYIRSIEKIYFGDRSDITNILYNNVRNLYTAAVTPANDDFYQNRIEEAKGNMEKLYSVISNLLRRSMAIPLPPHTSGKALPNDLQSEFYTLKHET